SPPWASGLTFVSTLDMSGRRRPESRRAIWAAATRGTSRGPPRRPAMYLGIDVGTSEVKVALVEGDRGGRVIAVGRAGLDVARPHPGWSEQDPDSWVRG